jgi:hypothetical protein
MACGCPAGIRLASGVAIDLARHFDAASRLSPKSAAIALRLLDRACAMVAPEVRNALRALLRDQADASEELTSSDLMVLATHDVPLPDRGFIFETVHHRMARLWIRDVAADADLRRCVPNGDGSS